MSMTRESEHPAPAHPTPARGRPTGRRSGDSGTRQDILRAASRAFAERGYQGASVRAIADAAGVDPALIRHFYVNKSTLFATVVSDSVVPKRLLAAFEGDHEGLGARLADSYLELWEHEGTRAILLAVVRSATTSEQAAALLAELMGAQIATLGTGTSELGFVLAASHLFGLSVARHVIKVPVVARAERATLVAAIAPTIQHYLDL